SEALVHLVRVSLGLRIEAADVQQRLIGERTLSPTLQMLRAVEREIRRSQRVAQRERDRGPLRHAELRSIQRHIQRRRRAPRTSATISLGDCAQLSLQTL